MKSVTPFPYQLECVDEISDFHGRALLAMDPGTGKSLISILWALENQSAWPVVVVCPAGIKWHWEREWWTHAGIRAEVLETRKVHPIISKPKVIIVNYDILKAWLPELKKVKPRLVIVDESHYIKSPKVVRSKSVRSLCKEVPHILALSGTPMTNRPAELWTTLNLICPDQYPSFFSYGLRHCAPRHSPWGWQFNGATRLKELHRGMVRNLMVRRTKKQVLKDLPAKLRHVLIMDVKDRKDYDHAKRDFLGWMATQPDKSLSGARRAEALVKLTTLKILAARIKTHSVVEWVEDFLEESGEKLILFGVHREILRPLHQRWKGCSVIVDGSVTGKKRELAINQFTQDKKTRLFVGNVQAAGVGWSAPGVSHVAFVEMGWTPAEHTQAEDRCVLEGTPILTPRGWVPIEDVGVGDKVITHTGAQRIVTATQWRRCTKVIAEVKINGWTEPITTTEDHRFLTESGEWKEAGQLRPGMWLATPENHTRKELKSIPFKARRITDHFEGAGGRQKNGRLKSAPEEIRVTDDFLFTLGYYIGDGFASVAPGKGRFVSLAGNTGKKWESLNRCSLWMSQQGLEASEKISDTGRGVERRFYSADWAFWFEKYCGRVCEKKKVPQFALRLNPRQTQILLDGLSASDGYTKKGKKRIRYSTTSKQLAAHVVILAQRAGYRPGITTGSTGQQEIAWGGPRGPRGHGRVVSVVLRHPKKVDAGKKEKVYDLSVEKDESFLTGITIVHNCHGLGRGQKGVKARIFYLVAKDTVEIQLAELLQRKQAILDRTLDGVENPGALDVFDLLMKSLRRKK